MALQEVHTGFTFAFDGSKLAAVQRGVKRASTNLDSIAQKTEVFTQRVGGAFQRIGQMVGAYVGYRAIRMLTTDFADAADAAAKTAEGLGLTVEQYTALKFVAEDGGIAMTELGNAMGKLSRRAVEAAKGSKENKKVFKDMGISVKGANGEMKTSLELLFDVSNKFKGMKQGSEKTALALKLFEETGAKFVNTMNLGAGGIKKLMFEAKRLGVTIDEDGAKKAAAYKAAMLRLSAVFKGVRNRIALQVIPAITKMAERFSKWASEGKNAERALRALKLVAIFAGIVIARLIGASVIRNIKLFVQGIWAGVQALRAMGIAGAATAIKLWAIIAAFALVAFAVEQLIGFARGQDTFLGRFLGDTKLAKKLKDALLDVWKAVKKAWKDIKPALLEAWKALKPALEDVWKALEPLIGPAFKAWIAAIVIHLKIFTTVLNGVRDAVAWIRHELYEADMALAGWADSIDEALTGAWVKSIDALKAAAKDVAKFVAAAWDVVPASVKKTINTIIEAAKTALYYMGLISGKTALVSPETLEKLKKTRESIAAQGMPAPAAPVTSAGGPIMPGLMLPYGGLMGGPIQSFAPGPGFQPPPAQAVTANVATGAVQLTVHATGDPKAIAAQVAPLVKRGINAAFTDASRDLVKPPRGQS